MVVKVCDGGSYGVPGGGSGDGNDAAALPEKILFLFFWGLFVLFHKFLTENPGHGNHSVVTFSFLSDFFSLNFDFFTIATCTKKITSPT